MVRSTKRSAVAGVFLCGCAVAWWYVESDLLPAGDQAPGVIPRRTSDSGYVSSASCRECHIEQYRSWQNSYHRSMTQVAAPETVLAPFSGVTLTSRNRTYSLFRKEDDFRITMPDPDWEHDLQDRGFNLLDIEQPPMVDRKVVLTTGSHHMQGYWIRGNRGNELRQFPWYYLIAEKRWVPREDVFLTPPGHQRHFKIWNNSCIRCHAVGGHPGLDNRQDQFVSHVAEFGISCEACHGQGQRHVQARREKRADPGDIANPRRFTARRASQVCAQCHSMSLVADHDRFLVEGTGFEPGADFDESFRLIRFEESEDRKQTSLSAIDFFWEDGTCKVGGDEYNGMSESACFQGGGLSCLSCHSMHNSHPDGQLAAGMDGDNACLQCHTAIRGKIETHTRHPLSSDGSRCLNCHMPHTSYALLGALRSHRIVTPVMTAVRTNSRPNACGLCHQDKPSKWITDQLAVWPEKPLQQTPVENADKDALRVPYSVQLLLQGDASQRVIAAWHMGWQPALEASGSHWQVPWLAELLDDPYAAVRFVASQSLRRLPGMEDFEYDYIGDRTHAKAQAIRLWESRQAVNEPLSAETAPMWAPQDRDTLIKELLKNRDTTPVTIPE